jgi:hypothetical protein
MPLRDDYIMRQVEAIAAMLARIAGLRLEGRMDEASAHLEQALGLLLDDKADLIRKVDSATAARLLRTPARILLYARLLREGASPGGRTPPRVAELVLEALRRDPDSAEARDLLKELRPSVDREQLGPAYRVEFDQADM